MITNATADSETSKKEWLWPVAGVAAIVGWLVFLAWSTAGMKSFSSPDEAANAFWATRYASTGQLSMPIPISDDAASIFRPRSYAVKDGQLLPGSFVGFVQSTGLLRRLGTYAPVIAIYCLFAGGLFAWYRIGRRYWEKPWAWGAVLLLATSPAIVTYVTHPWYHAAWYALLLLLTGLTLVRYQEKQTLIRAAIVGLVYGLTLFIRPVEALFTVPLIVVLMLVHRGKRSLMLIAGLITLIMQIPWLLAGRHVYGAFLGSGYSTSGVTIISGASEPGAVWWRIFVPPGGWTWHAFAATFESFVGLQPVVALLAVLALVFYFQRKFYNWQKILKIGVAALFIVYYLEYYGALDLYPNVPSRVGFLSSTIRYWLPLFIALTAGVVVFLRRVMGRQRIWPFFLIGIIVIMQMWMTIFGVTSGLNENQRYDQRMVAVSRDVVARTETDSIIFAGSLDKAIFPDRWASYNLPQQDADWAVVDAIAAERPVYIIGGALPAGDPSVPAWASEYGYNAINSGQIDGTGLWRLTKI